MKKLMKKRTGSASGALLAALAFAALAAIAAFVAFPFACSRMPGKTVSIRFGTHRSDQIDRNIRAVLDEFEKENPRIRVVAEPIQELEDSFEATVAAGNLCDVTVIPKVDPSRFPSLFLPVGDMGFSEETVKFYRNGLGPDGKLYTIAGGSFTPGLIYNKAALRKAGYDRPPADWKGFLVMCAKLKAAGVTPVNTNYASGWALYPIYYNLTKSLSGDPGWFESKAGADSLFAEGSPLREVFGKFRQLKDSGFLEKDLLTLDWAMSKKSQGSGDVAMMYLASWYPPQLIEYGAKPEDVDMVPFPGTKALLSIPDWEYAMAKSSKHPAEAGKLFRFLIREGKLGKALGVQTPLKDVKQPDLAGMAGLSGSPLPPIDDALAQPEFDARLSRTGHTLLDLFQQYLVAKDPEASLAEFDKAWAAAARQ